MAFIQEWAPFTNVTPATSRTQTGTATSPGNTLFLDVFVRVSSLNPTVTVTDDGAAESNNWELVESLHTGSANLYIFICRDAESVSSVTATFLDGAGEPISAPAAIFLSEFSDVGPLIAVTSMTEGDGGVPDVISLAAGDLLRSVFGSNVSDRTWTLAVEGEVEPTERAFWRGSQVEVRRTDAYSATATEAAVGWDLTAGTNGSVGIINMGYSLESGPTPLTVEVMGDVSGYVGLPASVSASTSGGSGEQSYAWTSDRGGSFASQSSASTTYTAIEADTHTLTCTVTDSTGSASDSLTFVAADLPTQNFAAASGWTSVVGDSRISALSDDDDETYVETGDDPDDEALTLTLPSISRPSGDLTIPLRLSAPEGTVVVTPTLTVFDPGPTSRTVTAPPITVTGDVTSYYVTFPAGGLAGTVDWGSGLTLTLAASVPG